VPTQHQKVFAFDLRAKRKDSTQPNAFTGEYPSQLHDHCAARNALATDFCAALPTIIRRGLKPV